MASLSQNNGVTLGALKPNSVAGDYNNIIFAVNQAISKLQTATLVQVKACTNDGDNIAVGFVDVLPLVNQIDGQGNPTPHVTVYNLPYLRYQGGTNAVILDPKVGDIGIAIFASRDISKVKTTKAQANPGSNRQYNFSDGLYLGGFLNAQPQQFVRFSDDGIEIKSGKTITLQAPHILIKGALDQSDGDVTMTGTLTAQVDVIANQISLHNHTHISASPGNPTGPPLP